MKLKAQLGNNEHEISLDLGSETAAGAINGRNYEVEVRELGRGEYLLLNGTNVYRCRVEPKRDSRNSFEVTVRGSGRGPQAGSPLGVVDYDITIIDPKRLRSAQSSSGHGHGAAEIISPMPGKVVRVLVTVGAQVEAGAGIIVVEAMKMQNEMKSPKAGVVISINAEAGATVNAGDVLAVIE